MKCIPPKEREQIVTRIERMEEDLQGDVVRGVLNKLSADCAQVRSAPPLQFSNLFALP